MKRALIGLAGIVCLVSLAASAAEFWEKKKFTQWNEEEVTKMLTESPWARQHTEGEVHIDLLGAPDDTEVRNRGGQREPRLTYQLQIRSALPIRQALVRRAQLQQGYDNLPAQQKGIFDQQAERFLAEEFPDQVVIHVSFESNVIPDVQELASYWRSQTTETVKSSVYLIGSKGRKAPLQEFLVADANGRAFFFTFGRTVDGETLAGPEDKNLRLEFLHPDVRGQGEKRVLVEFKIKKMMVDGRLVY